MKPLDFSVVFIMCAIKNDGKTMQKCGGQILFTSKSVGKTWRFKTPAKMCCTFLSKSAGEAGRVFSALGECCWC